MKDIINEIGISNVLLGNVPVCKLQNTETGHRPCFGTVVSRQATVSENEFRPNFRKLMTAY